MIAPGTRVRVSNPDHEHAGRIGTVQAPLEEFAKYHPDAGAKDGHTIVALDGEPGQVSRGRGQIARGGRGGVRLHVKDEDLTPNEE